MMPAGASSDAGSLRRLLRAAQAAGMTREQAARFLQMGYVPLPWAVGFHAAARQADGAGGPTDIACGGARGPGKSHAIMAQVSLDDCLRYAGINALFLRKVGKAAQESVEQLRRKTFINVPHRFNRQQGIIRYENGSTIVIGHFQHESDIDQYVGLEYDVIALEEATQLSGAKITALKGSLRSSKPGWRPRVYYSFNPGGVGHQYIRQAFVKPFRERRQTSTRFFPSTYRDNPFLNPEYITYLESLTGVLGRMWRDGNMDVGAGTFFVTWDHQTHVISPFVIPGNLPVWASLDYGFNHPTAVYWHTRRDGVVYTVAEHVVSRWLVPQHAGKIAEITAQLGRRVDELETFVAGPDVFSVDSDGKTVASRYAEQGITLTPANASRAAGAAEMLARLGNPAQGVAPTWYVFNTCQRLIECLPALQSDPHRPEDVLKIDADAEGNYGDDPYDAARYGLMWQPRQAGGGFSIRARR